MTKNKTCHDCKKELKKGDEYVNYVTPVGEFDKCRTCYEKDSALRNFQPCEVYSRIVGYIRPTSQWNVGKKEEFKDRVVYDPKKNTKTKTKRKSR